MFGVFVYRAKREVSLSGVRIRPMRDDYARQFITTVIIISFSSGFDSAIIMVRATSVWSSISLRPSAKSTPFLSRKYRNIVAAIRLLPSKKL